MLRHPRKAALALGFVLAALLAAVLWKQGPAAASTAQESAQSVRIAHLSDTHLNHRESPSAEQNLVRSAQQIAQRKPDAVIVTGDIAQDRAGWQRAREILSQLDAGVYYLPGNHDTTALNLDRYRKMFGEDYYRFEVGAITFLALNSQLMGNYMNYGAKTPEPLPGSGPQEFEKMLAWLKQQPPAAPGRPVIVVQHVPHARDAGVLPDPRPYWLTQEPYRSQVLAEMKRLGVSHILAGHWHRPAVFERDGITYHLAPATAWMPWQDRAGFAMHTVSPRGKVETEFVFPENLTRK